MTAVNTELRLHENIQHYTYIRVFDKIKEAFTNEKRGKLMWKSARG